MRFHVLIVAVLAAVLSGCAVSPPPTGNVLTRADLQSLEQGQEDLSQRLQKLQDNVVLVEARMQDQQRLIEDLKATVAALKVTPTGEKTGLAMGEPAVGTGAEPSLSPTEIYLKAFADYTSGRFRQAIAGFESFTNRYPESEYAGNAQYWLGECYYSLQRYDEAAQEFAKAVQEYPKGSKTPDALLKMASALLQMDQPERAGQALEILLQRYPDSSAAGKARASEPYSTILRKGEIQ